MLAKDIIILRLLITILEFVMDIKGYTTKCRFEYAKEHKLIAAAHHIMRRSSNGL